MEVLEAEVAPPQKRRRQWSEGTSSIALPLRTEFDDRTRREHAHGLPNCDQLPLESCEQHPDGIIRFDPDGKGSCTFKLMLSPLIGYSPYIKRHAEKADKERTDLEKKDKRQLVLRISECPGDIKILNIVESYCKGLLEANDISTLNVVKLIATCKFLEIEGLESTALQFFEENLVSARSCINVLATFDVKTSGDGKLAHVFHKCIDALMAHMTRTETMPDGRWSTACNFRTLLTVVQRTAPEIAAQIFAYCKEKRLGLYLEKSSSDKSHPMLSLSRSVLVCYHLLMKRSPGVSILNASIGYYSFSSFGGKEIGWLDSAFDRLQDMSKKLIFLLHIAKFVTLDNCAGTSSDLVQISHSNMQWGFLCLVLKQSARFIDVMKYRNLSADPRDLANLKDLDREVEQFQKIIGQSLAHHTLWESEESSKLVFQSLKMFDFKIILQIVRHFKELPMSARFSRSRGVSFYNGVVELLDTVVEERLRAGTLSTQEAMAICQEFPMNARMDPVKIYDVLQTVITGSFESDSGEGLLQFMGWLNLDQIPDEILERIGILPPHGRHLLRKIVMKGKADAAYHGVEKRKKDQEVIMLLNDLEGQKKEILAVRKNCTELLEGKAAAEYKSNKMIANLETEKAKFLKLEEQKAAALAVESRCLVNMARLNTELRAEKSKCSTLEEEKAAAESRSSEKIACLEIELRAEKAQRLKLGEEKVAEQSRLSEVNSSLEMELRNEKAIYLTLLKKAAATESRLEEKIGNLEGELKVEHDCVTHLVQSTKALESKLKGAEGNLENEQRSCEIERKKLHEVQKKLHREQENGRKCYKVKTDMTKMKVKLDEVSNDRSELFKNKDLLESQLKAERAKTDLLESEIKDVKDKSGCQICFVKQRDTLIFPCMHLLYCSDCLDEFRTKNNTCPTCRRSIDSVHKYYSSV